MGRWKPYFTIKGRATRLEFWRYQLAQALVAAMIMCLTVPATVVGGWLGFIPFMLFAPLIVAAVCIAIRRLHDRNRAMWWIVPVTFGPLVLAGLAQLFGESQEIGAALGRLFFMLASLGMWIWGWAELGFLRGTPGENRYGAPT